MTLGEVKKMALSLIEEINPKSDYLTDDDDIKAKLNYVCNAIQIDLAQLKRISKKYIFEKNADITELNLPSDFYQLNKIKDDVAYEIIGNTIYFDDDYVGDITMFYFAYPTQITDNTSNDYELEIDLDAQIVMPYGIASDVLKADISSDYSIYEAKYQNLKANLNSGAMSVIGGLDL